MASFRHDFACCIAAINANFAVLRQLLSQFADRRSLFSVASSSSHTAKGNRHAAGQLQSVSGPALGVASAGVGKINFDLANGPAVMTLHTRQGGDDDGLFQADRRSPKFSLLEPSTDHVSTAAHWTANRLFTWLDMKSRDTSGKLDPGLPVATDAKELIQLGGGHVRFSKKT
ncbi:hypothetical protein [Rhodopirellula sallentina]|nr:hypothetical protein [Rhodopirellula sallentina]